MSTSMLSASSSYADVALVVSAVEDAEERIAAEAAEAAAEAEEDELSAHCALLSVDADAGAERIAVLAAARRAKPDPSAASLLKVRQPTPAAASAHAPAQRTPAAPFTSGDFISGQVHENDKAEVVIVCEPDMHSNIMGALHPAGSLYERPVNMRQCTLQHEAFRAALRSNGVHCLTVREILLFDTARDVRARVELEDLAAGRLRYELDPNCEQRLLSQADRFYIGDTYKRQVLESSSAEQLVDIVLCGPTVHVMPSFRDTGFTARYSFEPLTNVQFTRDQQVTTARGIVMARLRSPQRQCESELLDFCFRKIGLPILGRVHPPAYLEGGDFFPAGPDLAMVGVGLRSNIEAALQLMQEELFGTRRVAVVRDDFEKDQTRMHLDCIFNIVSDNVVLLAEDVIGEASPLRRLVDEYVRVEAWEGEGPRYALARTGVEFSRFLAEEGYHIVPISRQHQLEYACNVLNLGDSTLLSCHPETARQLVRCPQFHGTVQLLEFGAVTSMYGSLHCSSQVVRRTPSTE